MQYGIPSLLNALCNTDKFTHLICAIMPLYFRIFFVTYGWLVKASTLVKHTGLISQQFFLSMTSSFFETPTSTKWFFSYVCQLQFGKQTTYCIARKWVCYGSQQPHHWFLAATLGYSRTTYLELNVPQVTKLKYVFLNVEVMTGGKVQISDISK